MWIDFISFSVVFIFGIALFIQLVGFIERLKSLHTELYEKLGGSKLELFGGSPKAQRELMNYIKSGKHKALDDPKLNRIGNSILYLKRIVFAGFIIVFIIRFLTP